MPPVSASAEKDTAWLSSLYPSCIGAFNYGFGVIEVDDGVYYELK